jgi:hypothetical protein
VCLCLSVCARPHTDSIKRVLEDYHERINSLEDVKFDLEYAVKKKDYEVELSGELVNFCLEIYLFLVVYVQGVYCVPIVSLSSSCFISVLKSRIIGNFSQNRKRLSVVDSKSLKLTANF